jgi:fucose permease
MVLGLPDGMLGPAWPEMRQTFGAPIAALGLILLVSTGGSVAISVFVGWLIQRIGVPALLATAGICAALGGAGFALARACGSSWPSRSWSAWPPG